MKERSLQVLKGIFDTFSCTDNNIGINQMVISAHYFIFNNIINLNYVFWSAQKYDLKICIKYYKIEKKKWSFKSLYLFIKLLYRICLISFKQNEYNDIYDFLCFNGFRVIILEKEIATTHQSLLNFVSSRKYTWQKFT